MLQEKLEASFGTTYINSFISELGVNRGWHLFPRQESSSSRKQKVLSLHV